MENTNTDARKAARDILHKYPNFFQGIDPFWGETNAINAMLEFAQYRHATLDKGNIDEKDFGEYLISTGYPIERIISTSLSHHLYPLSFLLGYAKWRESLYEKPEEKL